MYSNEFMIYEFSSARPYHDVWSGPNIHERGDKREINPNAMFA